MTKQVKGDPAVGRKLKAYLTPRVRAAGYTFESLTAELGRSKSAATGWFNTGQIGKNTIFAISEKIPQIVASEVFAILGLADGQAAGASTSDASLTPEARHLIGLIRNADTSQSVSSDSWGQIAGIIQTMMNNGRPAAPVPKTFRK